MPRDDLTSVGLERVMQLCGGRKSDQRCSPACSNARVELQHMQECQGYWSQWLAPQEHADT